MNILITNIHLLQEQFIATHSRWPKLVKCVSFVAASLGLLVVRGLWHKLWCRIYKYPPYISGYPIVGSAITIAIWKETYFTKLLPSYGDLVMYTINNLKFCDINSFELYEKVFNKAFDRGPMQIPLFENFGFEPSEVGVGEDRGWSQRRKILMRSLTTILSKSETESNISDICGEILFKEIENVIKNDNGLWYPRNCVQCSVFNVIYGAMFGKQKQLTMPDSIIWNNYVGAIEGALANGTMVFLSFDIPLPSFLSNLIFGKSVQGWTNSLKTLYDATETDYKASIGNIDTSMKSNERATSNYSSLSECINKEYFESDTDKYANFQTKFSKKKLERFIVADLALLLVAGMHTTSHATEVAAILLAKYPKIQDIVYKELVNAYGKNGKFSFDKLFDCPQFRAFVHESLRLSMAVPNGLERVCKRDIRCVKIKDKENSTSEIVADYVGAPIWNKIEKSNTKVIIVEYDYIIPKNTVIQGNMQYILHFQEQEAKELNLNHWLRKDNDNSNRQYVFVNKKESAPFGIGKRDCLGQALAMKEIHAFLGNLILNYQIKPPDGIKPQQIDIKFRFGERTGVVEPPIPVIIENR